MALKDILGGLFSKVLEQGADIADEFTLSPEERAEFRQRDAERMAQLQQAVMENVRARYKQVAEVIQAEMAQGDKFTKRARPSVVYAGIFLHLVKMLASPWFTLTLDENFTYVWGAVCSVWFVGRSFERTQTRGIAGKVAEKITGNQGLPEL